MRISCLKQYGSIVLERFRKLNRYQRGVLIFITVMTLIFTAVYSITISREGFLYKGAILVPRQEDGGTVYSGKIRGNKACFTVYEDGTVTFLYGDTLYGPYTVREDKTAVPQALASQESVTGIEIRLEETVLFRGGVQKGGSRLPLYNEDGSLYSDNSMGRNRRYTGPMDPSVPILLDLIAGPRLVHKGTWAPWFISVLCCLVTAVSVLFADELFRWHLSFQIRNADLAEPSEWEIAERYIAWTLLPLLALALFIAGLLDSPF